ncbi:bifunctional D-glycero-beta-D-manno-heptose-7-phosphate kinase/D-glycero-beta-D-manno-heptose 1-phosphate adenylyltransferase HldE [Aestuariirhabdus sp. LZHN29]|uniref:bifunctional D-glycero-beta-D-manno-heptose-7-phosphate kinase/D-glycero-beta-D-manno-heptose 1-phosphate adenylyltransferase HldE n=1 Tax=Aestuariirhabdus sp. LZHN29 TaxID=3417462 RepID=UPI003CF8357C
MKLTLPRFDQARVLVIGDVMLDRYWHGATSRISPEAPVPVVKVNQVEDRPGGAGNVALNVAALGAPAFLVAPTGDDEAAAVLRTRLEAAGVYCDFETVDGDPTITKLRVISHSQQLIRLDFEEPFEHLDISALTLRYGALLANVDVVILSDYSKGALRNHQQLIAMAREAGVAVLADPKGHDFSLYRGATLITPNLHEFEAVVGHCRDEQTLVDKGVELLRELDLQALLVTRGEHGMTLLREGEPELHLPAKAREVYDVTGAGDTVISVLATALAAGERMPQAVALANIAAGVVVGKLGTAVISAPELRRAVHKSQGSERGVMSADQLLVAVEDARAHGEKIVFTNGCFDILHAGHVGYLEQARSLGDRLIVAVNSDASVKRLKGEGRPINPAERRMAVLAGLEAVDWSVCFAEDTPESLLAMIRPDVLVKGGDYGVDGVVGGDIVREYGGEVAVLDFLDNCSTTAIVNKILDKP